MASSFLSEAKLVFFPGCDLKRTTIWKAGWPLWSRGLPGHCGQRVVHVVPFVETLPCGMIKNRMVMNYNEH